MLLASTQPVEMPCVASQEISTLNCVEELTSLNVIGCVGAVSMAIAGTVTCVVPHEPSRAFETAADSAASMVSCQRYFTSTQSVTYRQAVPASGGIHSAGSRSLLDWFTLSVTASRPTSRVRSLA